jgi:ComF family protein
MNKRLKFNHLFFDGLLRSPCLLCLAANSSALGLCQPCLDDLPWLPDALCSQCALPCTDKVCGHCLSDPPYFDACYGVFSYQFPISALLQDYKYGSKLHLARSFALLLKNRVPLHTVDTVIAMPMHPQRLKERGFNQALEIARVLCAEQAQKLDFDSVQRQKHRPAQVSLSWQARLKNIKGVFKLQSASRIAGQRIAILDDVMTTGASLNELAKTLKQAGASHVECWIVARTLARP